MAHCATFVERLKSANRFKIKSLEDFMGIIVFILWLVLAFVVAAGAKNKGRSYGGFLAISILFSPLIGAFILLILGEKK